MPFSRHTFLAGSAAFATIGIAVPVRAAEFDIKFGTDLPQEHPVSVRTVEAFARIAKATNGRVAGKVFPASVLGSDPSMISQLRSGAVEMLAMPGAFLTFSPVAGIENLAFGFKDRGTVFRAMDGDLGKLIRDDIASKGVVCLDKIWESGFRSITTSTKPIHAAADLSGLKIRVSPGKIRIDTFASLGASPTPIALSELYTALQTHVVDAQENPLVLINQQKFFEVQKYVSLSEHIWSGYWDARQRRYLEAYGTGRLVDRRARDRCGNDACTQRHGRAQSRRRRPAHASRHEIQCRRQAVVPPETHRREVLRSLEDGVRCTGLDGTRKILRQNRLSA